MDSLGEESKLAANCNGGDMSAASSGARDANSDYSELRKNSSENLDNFPEIKSQIRKLEQICEEVSTQLKDISAPMVLFNQPHEINLMKPVNKGVNPTRKP